ncbi:MAG TPA: serine hydrolase domain-containing protein [Verrucomicrobiae bacterium]
MIHRLMRVAALLWVAMASLHAAEAPSSSPRGALAPVLQPFVDRQVIAGAVALVANKDKMLDVTTVGVSSLDAKTPMRADNLFWLASMTKTFTATALMILVDEGKVNVDDPVEKYLPEFKGQMVADGKDKPHSPTHPITIKELLTHTSGLIGPHDPPIKPTHVLKEDADQYARAPLKREPGTKFEYNNSGINTVGRIIEVVSGMPYAEFVRQRLLGPLGMKDTGFWPDEEQVSRLAKTSKSSDDKTAFTDLNFKIDQGQLAKAPAGPKVPVRLLTEQGSAFIMAYALGYAWPAGGLFSTADDVAKFGQMLLNGGERGGRRYLSERTVKQMTSDQTGSIKVNPHEALGLGWFVKLDDVEGSSAGSYGHRGARGPVYVIDPNNGLVMILLVESWDLKGDEQKKLYSAFFHAAVEKFGKSRRR